MLAQAVLQFSRMARRGDRTAFVQTLRTHARSCSVDLCRDDASRARVTAMVEGVRASTGPTADKRGAEEAFKQYEGPSMSNHKTPQRQLLRKRDFAYGEGVSCSLITGIILAPTCRMAQLHWRTLRHYGLYAFYDHVTVFYARCICISSFCCQS